MTNELDKRDTFTYFVSYYYLNGRGPGSGNCEIELDKEINRIGDIRGIENTILAEIDSEDAVIMDFRLLSAPCDKQEDDSNRVAELEQEIASHAPEGRNYTNAQYVELLLKHERLEEQLKQAIEVLEFIVDRSEPAFADVDMYALHSGMVEIWQRVTTLLPSLSQGTEDKP